MIAYDSVASVSAHCQEVCCCTAALRPMLNLQQLESTPGMHSLAALWQAMPAWHGQMQA